MRHPMHHLSTAIIVSIPNFYIILSPNGQKMMESMNEGRQAGTSYFGQRSLRRDLLSKMPYMMYGSLERWTLTAFWRIFVLLYDSCTRSMLYFFQHSCKRCDASRWIVRCGTPSRLLLSGYLSGLMDAGSERFLV